MSQKKSHSFLEAICNVIVGYLVALTSQLVIFYFYDVHLALSTNMIIGVWFSVISIIRSYCLRRLFNRVTG